MTFETRGGCTDGQDEAGPMTAPDLAVGASGGSGETDVGLCGGSSAAGPCDADRAIDGPG